MAASGRRNPVWRAVPAVDRRPCGHAMEPAKGHGRAEPSVGAAGARHDEVSMAAISLQRVTKVGAEAAMSARQLNSLPPLDRQSSFRAVPRQVAAGHPQPDEGRSLFASASHPRAKVRGPWWWRTPHFLPIAWVPHSASPTSRSCGNAPRCSPRLALGRALKPGFRSS